MLESPVESMQVPDQDGAQPRGRRPGSPKPAGSGRKPGVKNKINSDLKETILLRGRPVELLCDIARGMKIRVGPQAGPGEPEFVYPSLADRISAARTLLGKILPDMKAIEATQLGEDGRPVNPAAISIKFEPGDEEIARGMSPERKAAMGLLFLLNQERKRALAAGDLAGVALLDARLAEALGKGGNADAAMATLPPGIARPRENVVVDEVVGLPWPPRGAVVDRSAQAEEAAPSPRPAASQPADDGVVELTGVGRGGASAVRFVTDAGRVRWRLLGADGRTLEVHATLDEARARAAELAGKGKL